MYLQHTAPSASPACRYLLVATYCCCLIHLLLPLACENQAKGRSGLEAILGKILSNQFLGRFGRSLEHDVVSFTRGENPIVVATKGAMSGNNHACCMLKPHFSWLLSTSNFSWTPHSSTGPHRHAGVNPLPHWICAVPAIASATILGPVSMWICHMYARIILSSKPCPNAKNLGEIVWFQKNCEGNAGKSRVKRGSLKSMREKNSIFYFFCYLIRGDSGLMPVARGSSRAKAPPLAARPTVWLPAWTTSLTRNWAHHSCFPPSSPVANPGCNRIFWWRRVLVPPSTSFILPVCPSPWQFYYDCNCRERVHCLIHVTCEFKSVDLVTNPQDSHSQMSLKSSQNGQQHPVQYCCQNGNGKELGSLVQVRLLLRVFLLLFFLQTSVALGSGRWRVSRQLSWDLRSPEILPSLRTFTNEAERTLDPPTRRSRQCTSPWLWT